MAFGRSSELQSPEYTLLAAILPLLVDVAKFYTSDHESAVKARRAINKKQGRCKPFHACIYLDLWNLLRALDAVSASVQDRDQTFIESGRELLQVLDEYFVSPLDSDSVLSGATMHSEVDDFCPRVRQFLLLAQTHCAVLDRDERLLWLRSRIKLKHPQSLAQHQITTQVRKCQFTIAKPVDSFRDLAYDVPSLTDRTKGVLWHDSKHICDAFERLHAQLQAQWACHCQSAHEDARFFLEIKPAHDLSQSHGSMVCQRCDSSGSWWHATIQRDAIAGAHFRISPCDHFTGLEHSEGTATGPPRDLRTTLLKPCGECCKPLSLEERLQSQSQDSLEHMTRSERFRLALFLSYLYLHLGGGPWWPYDRVDDALWFWKHDSRDRQPFHQILFAPSLHAQSEGFKPPFLERGMNYFMPSLPNLGRQLLSIAMGRDIEWKDMEEAMQDYAQNEAFAEEIIGVVVSCVGTDDPTFKRGGSIRENESLRLAFTTRVVRRLQHVLTVGFGIKLDSFLQEMAIGPCKDNVFNVKRPAPLPVRKRGLQSRRCVHHNGDAELVELLNETESVSAAKWLENLTSSVRATVSRYDTVMDYKPSRVAVIDTGVCIDELVVDMKYDSRLKECRSWLDEAEGDRGRQEGFSSDSVGHGTHAVSLALESTTYSNCEVYAAQVFSARLDRQNIEARCRTHVAIARAIKYAVHVWEVDVISLSFGFRTRIPVIDEAITEAASKTVLLAAASNAGGNAPISWPARHHNVLSVFATDGEGNRYPKNPSPRANDRNFAVLGSSVEGCWPPALCDSGRSMHKSGTSCAAPIAAGIAGVVIDLMRRCQQEYLKATNDRRRKQYDDALRVLRTAGGMKAVFDLMASRREGYDYIIPWSLFGDDDEETAIVAEILKALKHC